MNTEKEIREIEREIEIETESSFTASKIGYLKLAIDTNALKIQYASIFLKWLDKMEMKYPEARDSIHLLTEQLLEIITGFEDEMCDHFDDLLEVSGLSA